MLRRFSILALFSAAVLACPGCHGGLTLNIHDDHYPVPVYHETPVVQRTYVDAHAVDHVHVCSHKCHDHFWNGSKVVVLSGHRHGPHCGHRWDGEYWVTVHKSKAIRGHGHAKRVKTWRR